MRKPETVWVRNNGTEAFSSRYDGEDFKIEPGQSAEMLVDCAVLCLGFGDDDKIRCIRRLGWAFTGDQMKLAEKRLASFSFHMKESEAEAGASGAPSRSAAPASGEPLAPASADAGEVATGDGKSLKPILHKLAPEPASPAAG